MEKRHKRLKQLVPLLLLFLTVIAVRVVPGAGEWYARKAYPAISGVLSAASAWLPFSLGDVFVVLSVAGILSYLGYTLYKRRSFKNALVDTVIFLGYVYVWFYLAWGLNYSRADFYTRTGIPYAPFKAPVFCTFVTNYLDSLNAAYTEVETVDTASVQREVTEQYNRIAARFGMFPPETVKKPKPMLSSALMSKTGVLGYMEPFFSEFCLNRDLLPVQYPATYAHELSHRLSIASEAEANLYAYLTCTASGMPAVRFSGYFSLFPYVMQNAAMSLPEAEYKELLARVRPEIIDLYARKRKYWEARYSQTLGDMQDAFYNFYLKGNNIPTGTANYSEVVGLLVSYEQAQRPERRIYAEEENVSGKE